MKRIDLGAGPEQAVKCPHGRNSQELARKFSIHSLESWASRHAAYEAIRSDPSVRIEVDGGYVGLARYADIYAAARIPEILSSFPLTIPAESFGNTDADGNPVPLIPQEIDPPDHAKYRRMISPSFAPKPVKSSEAELVSIMEELLDGLATRGRSTVDLTSELAFPFPSRVILGIYLKIGSDDWEWLTEQVVYLVGGGGEGSASRAAVAGGNLHTYFIDLVRRRRVEGGVGDVLSILDQNSTENIDEQGLLGFCFSLLSAGLETVANLLTRLLLLMIDSPNFRAELESVIDDNFALESAVEEIIRFLTPAPGLGRTARSDCPVGGTSLRQGERVLLMYDAANRDPAVFVDPDSMILDRQPNRHVSFGSGIHRCLGVHLAQLEIKTFLRTFLKRAPGFSIAPGEKPVWHAGNTWGVSRLPVVFDGHWEH